MRRCELHLPEAFLDAVGGLPNQKVQAAVGYLCLWGAGSERYRNVTVFGGNNGDLHATYRDDAGGVTYTLFGQRHVDGGYSFHS